MVSKVTKTVDQTHSGTTPAPSNRPAQVGNTPGSAQPGVAMSPGDMHIATPIANGSPGGSSAGLAHTEGMKPSAAGPAASASAAHGSTPGEGMNHGPKGSTGGGK